MRNNFKKKSKSTILAATLAMSLCGTFSTVPVNASAITVQRQELSNADKLVVDCINASKSHVTVNSRPNVKLAAEKATNKFVSSFRIKRNADSSYTVFFNYYSVSNIETHVRNISKHTEQKWGVTLAETPYKELAIAQYLIDNGVEYNKVNYNPDKLLTEGGSCQAIALFSSAVLSKVGAQHEVVTGKYSNGNHMWLYSNGSMHDISFAVESKDVQYALQSDPTVYKYDNEFKLDQNNTYTPVGGAKILSTGKETFALREDGKVMRLTNGKQYLIDVNAKDITLSGGNVVVVKDVVKADTNK